MRNLLIALALTVLCLSFSTDSFAGKQNFLLVNDTGVEIQALYVSPTKSDDWGDDILGEDVLPDGESVIIQFSRDEKACLWDFSVEDPEETSVEWTSIDLCKYEKITLHMEGDKVWATFE